MSLEACLARASSDPSSRQRGGIRRSARAGFTLIEALVALVVLAVVMVIAQRGIVTARIGLDRALSSAAAEAVARSIVETQLGLLATAPGVREGQTDGVDWRVTAEPLDLPLPPAPPPPQDSRTTANGAAPPGEAGGAEADAASKIRWRPLRVRVTVSNGRGRPLTFETIHLAVEP